METIVTHKFISSKCWDRYNNSNSAQRGFAVAPILYVLGLVGVLGGVLFSSTMQITKSNLAIQNALTVRSDLQAASNTLSAEAVFSADSTTLCPPRSTHQSNGNPCAAAPVSLVQFGDLTNKTQLPANYANATTTGSPAEVGVFAAAAGLKQLDAYGHSYIYCRWENQRSNPAANAFVLLSAGPDGNLQTRCGDMAAQGDDTMIALTVGAAINRATLWQANGTSNISYGATGTQVTIDSSGDLTAAGSLTVTGASTLNSGLSVNNGDLVLANGYSFAQIDSTGNARRLIALSPTNDVLVGGHNGTKNIYFLTNNATVGWFNSAGVLSAFGGMITPNITLTAYSAQPASCAPANNGTIAATVDNGLCFCNGTAWRKVESPATACAW